jgi:Uma2 family endonuclease
MAVPQAQLLMTVGEYLDMERQADERHEYLDGHLYAMAGESDIHADVCTNLILLIGNQLEDGPCRVRSKDSKVRSGPLPLVRRSTKGLFSYPDLVVICGDPQYLDEHRDALLNPTVIIEVLSESAEKFDRSTKFLRYQQWNPTLVEYVLVSQDEPAIELLTRQSDGSWKYTAFVGLEQSVRLESIACTLPLDRVYRRIVFPTPEEDEPELPS